MIDAILKGFGLIVKFCYNIGGKNYLLALIIFAVIVKIAMLPLSIKQQKNSIKQARLRPKEMAIRKKYTGRNDQASQQKLQSEIVDLYTKENFSPIGGCLPLVIQLPILLGLYQVIIRPLEFLCNIPKDVVKEIMASDTLKNIVSKTLAEGQNLEKTVKSIQQIGLVDIIKNNFNEFTSTISEYVKSASELPNFDFFGLNLAQTPSINNLTKEGLLLLIIPVLTFVCMFFSMRITRKYTYNAAEGTPQADNANVGCSMKMMDYVMPLMSVYITFIVPAVIGIYWIVNNLIGMIQQIILAKFMPIPKFTDEDYKQAEREMKGKGKNGKAAGEKKKVRSLHRIDEEDYVAPEPETKKVEQKGGLAGMIEKPELKEDEKKEEN